jgi:hypothetical protein
MNSEETKIYEITHDFSCYPFVTFTTFYRSMADHTAQRKYLNDAASWTFIGNMNSISRMT